MTDKDQIKHPPRTSAGKVEDLRTAIYGDLDHAGLFARFKTLETRIDNMEGRFRRWERLLWAVLVTGVTSIVATVVAAAVSQ